MRKGPGSFYDNWNISVVIVTLIFHRGQPSHGGDRTIFEVMTSTLPKGSLGSAASLLHVAATLYQGNPDRNYKLWNSVSSERYILHMQVLLSFTSIKQTFPVKSIAIKSNKIKIQIRMPKA